MARFNSSKLRSAISRYNSAVSRYNSAVRQHNARARRAISDYNRSVRSFSSHLNNLRRQLQNMQRSRSTLRAYVELRTELRYVVSYQESTLVVRDEEWERLASDEQEELGDAAQGEDVEVLFVDNEGNEVGRL